ASRNFTVFASVFAVANGRHLFLFVGFSPVGKWNAGGNDALPVSVWQIGGQLRNFQNPGIAARERKERRKFQPLCDLCALLWPVLKPPQLTDKKGNPGRRIAP